MECLDGIIGVSQTGCDCLLDGLGSDDISAIQLSNSGVYLDQLEGFNLEVAKSGDDCARGGVWDRALNAIEQAKLDFKTNLLACIGQTYKPRIDPLSIQLGGSTYTGSLNLTTSFAGAKIYPMQIKGGVIFLKRIGILVNTSTDVTIKIYSNENGGTLVYTSTPVAAVANTLTWAVPDAPIELPMWSYNVLVRYYVLLELDGSFQPKANTKDCGCAGTQKPYLRWLDFEGVKGSDVANVDGFLKTNELNGVVLDVDIKCKAAEIICSAERPLDFENDSDSLAIAYAIRFRAAARMYSGVLSSTNISRTTLLDREQMAKLVDGWNATYTEWINYLCGNVDNQVNGCWVCKQTATSLIKNTILATKHQRHINY